jgi:hypothetical protein
MEKVFALKNKDSEKEGIRVYAESNNEKPGYAQ